MKKLLILLTVALMATTCTHAQSDSTASKSTTEIKLGFMFAPQGGISLKDQSKGFESFYPMFIVTQIFKKDWIITPFYNMTANCYGTAVEYAVTKKCGLYVVGTKGILKGGGYVGAGIDTPVMGELAAGFVEVGTDWPDGNPYLFTGVFIPLTFRLK